MTTETPFRHQQLHVTAGDIHVIEAGPQDAPAIVFLHGWPQSWFAFQHVMQLASQSMHAFALDLPGIGGSQNAHVGGRKRDIARVVHEVITTLNLSSVILVGHDCGGQVAYAYLSQYHDTLQKAVIFDVAVPGVAPWDQVIRNPHIWHFAFHSIPDLPETLVQGKESIYFDFFYTATCAHPERITPEMRQIHAAAYATPAALRAGFDWYRAFDTDVNDTLEFVRGNGTIETPVLYLRGDKGWADIATYVEGFQAAAIQTIQSGIIEDSGHFGAEEQPERLWKAIEDFLQG